MKGERVFRPCMCLPPVENLVNWVYVMALVLDFRDRCFCLEFCHRQGNWLEYRVWLILVLSRKTMVQVV